MSAQIEAAARRMAYRSGYSWDQDDTPGPAADRAHWRDLARVGLQAADGGLAPLAGDMWNELENLRDLWEGTDRAPFCEEWIARYEQLTGLTKEGQHG